MKNLPNYPSKHLIAQGNLLRLKWHLQARVCAPLATGCVVGRGGTAEEGEDPWTEVGGCRTEGAAWGEGGENEEQEEEEVHQEGNEEGTSPLKVEGPTLEAETEI